MVESSEEKISFKALTVNDLQCLHKWLLSPHVKDLYDNGKQSFEDVEKKYIPRIRGESPTSCFQILCDGTPIGQIQMYKINDYPEYKQALQIEENAAGVDLFIGEKEFQHRGLGSIIIRKFLKEFVFVQLVVESCIIGPHPKNIVAIRAYQKAGFKHIKTIVNPEGEEEYLMKQTKEAIWEE